MPTIALSGYCDDRDHKKAVHDPLPTAPAENFRFPIELASGVMELDAAWTIGALVAPEGGIVTKEEGQLFVTGAAAACGRTWAALRNSGHIVAKVDGYAPKRSGAERVVNHAALHT